MSAAADASNGCGGSRNDSSILLVVSARVRIPPAVALIVSSGSAISTVVLVPCAESGSPSGIPATPDFHY